MKQITALLILIGLCFSCETKTEGYVLTGTIDTVPNGTRLILKSLEENRQINLDTASVSEGNFKFEGTIDKPNLCFLEIDGLRGRLPFILENTDLNFTLYKDSLSLSKITGSKENDLSLEYMNHLRKVKKRGQALSGPYAVAKKKNDTIEMKRLDAEIETYKTEVNDFNKEFITKNKNSLFIAFLFENLLNSKGLTESEAQSILNDMSDETLKTAPIARIEKKLKANASTAIGQIAPAFSGPSPDGSIIDLEKIKGKVTIIDFWAAWCGPCRRENPNVVKVYKEFHDKGLEIIGVSLDGNTRQKDAKGAWIKAIEDDGLTWHHVSNLNYFNDPIAKLYNIQSIPAAFILDGDGKIVAKNLRGNELRDKIAELLN
jgi:thiol-disulfide isomerase/thioredoxin